MMDRRTLAAGLAASAAFPMCARAQAPKKPWRIGILGASTTTAELTGPEPSAQSMKALLKGLADQGLLYGRDYTTEPIGGEGRPELFKDIAAELVRRQPDVIVSPAATVRALAQATKSIPIVVVNSGDPVRTGLIQSLAKPGGNITGLSDQSVDTAGKRLELLRETVPGNGALAIIVHPSNGGILRAAQEAAIARGWRFLTYRITDPVELAGHFAAAKRAGVDGVLLSASVLFFNRPRDATDLAAQAQMPAIYESRVFVTHGGLMSYGPDTFAQWHRAADFVIRILNGAKPADTPVEQPTRFEFVVHKKTAAALGLTIPPTVLIRADEVIE